MTALPPAAPARGRAAPLAVNEAPPARPRVARELAGALPGLVRDLVRARTLLRTLVWRDLKARYQSSSLGYLWTLLNPLVLLLVYSWVFSSVLRVPVEDFPLYLASGLLPWIWTAESLTAGTASIVANAGMVRRVALPVEVLPVSVVLGALVHFLLALPVLFGALFLFGRGPSWETLALPVVMGAHLCLLVGVVLITATLQVRFRDLSLVLSNLLLLLVFSAPILYPLELVPPEQRTLLLANPLTLLVEAYHDVLFRVAWPDWRGIVLPLWVVSAAVLWLGAAVARRHRGSLVEDL
jgi:ABC-type polysaccharide/polyol phosphate export permease